MSWFASLKEKSMQIAQLYKNELSNFVTNLNEDMTNNIRSNEESFELDPESPGHDEPETQKINLVTPSGHQPLIEILQPYISKEINEEELQIRILKIFGDLDAYVYKDPTALVLLDRTDFTSFEDFQQYFVLPEGIYEKIVDSDSNLQKLMDSDDFKDQKNVNSDSSKTHLLRFLYCLIYLFESQPLSESSNQSKIIESPENLGPPKETGAVCDIGDAVDALEKKSELSEPFVLVEDGSSKSNHSNETEKIESGGQRDVVSVSGSEDWQVEEKTFTIEFNN